MVGVSCGRVGLCVECLYEVVFFVFFGDKSEDSGGEATRVFRKEVVDLGLDKILTIKYKTGILGGIFGYGTLTLQTPLSGGAGEMVITMVRKPQKIYNLLQDLASKVEG